MYDTMGFQKTLCNKRNSLTLVKFDTSTPYLCQEEQAMKRIFFTTYHMSSKGFELPAVNLHT